MRHNARPTHVKVGQVWEVRSTKTGAWTAAKVTHVNGPYATLMYELLRQHLQVDVDLLLHSPDRFRLVTDVP